MGLAQTQCSIQFVMRLVDVKVNLYQSPLSLWNDEIILSGCYFVISKCIVQYFRNTVKYKKLYNKPPLKYGIIKFKIKNNKYSLKISCGMSPDLHLNLSPLPTPSLVRYSPSCVFLIPLNLHRPLLYMFINNYIVLLCKF